MNRSRTQLTKVLLGLCLMLLTGHAVARDFQIEVVIFETAAADNLASGSLYYPKLGRTLNLNSEAAEAAGFVRIDEGLSLSENASSIAGSRRYRVLTHLAWRQPGLDEASAIPVRVSLGQTSEIYLPENISSFEDFIPASGNPSAEYPTGIKTSTINGSIKVHLGRFLHMTAVLAYTDSDTGQSFRLSQARKMRSTELHYIDNPRFGLLTRILPLEELEEAEAAEALEAPLTSEVDQEPSTAAQTVISE